MTQSNDRLATLRRQAKAAKAAHRVAYCSMLDAVYFQQANEPGNACIAAAVALEAAAIAMHANYQAKAMAAEINPIADTENIFWKPAEAASTWAMEAFFCADQAGNAALLAHNDPTTRRLLQEAGEAETDLEAILLDRDAARAFRRSA